jgi:hypothetical protein
MTLALRRTAFEDGERRPDDYEAPTENGFRRLM